jgi:hypothetical protein
LLLAAFMVLINCPARADLVLPGHKTVRHEIVFTGLDRYPGHEFYLVPSIRGLRPVQRLQNGSPTTFYKHLSMTLVAADAGSVQDPESLHDTAGLPTCKHGFTLDTMASRSDPVARRLSTYRVDSIEDVRVTVSDLGTTELDASGRRVDRSVAGLLTGPPLASLLALVVLAIVHLRRRREAV